MKKFVLYIIVFFAAVVVIDFAVGKAGDYMQFHSKGATTKCFNDLCLNDTHEVLIMGSSRAHHHYVPQILCDSLGMEVFNAGYDGNGIILSYGIIQIIKDRYSPQLIIYDVEPAFDINKYSADNNCTRYLKFLKPYYRNQGVAEIIRKVSRKDFFLVHSGLCRYNSSCITLFTDYFINTYKANDGYAPLYGEMNPNKKHSPISTNHVIDSTKIYYIEQLVTFCNEAKIPLVLVASPKYGDYQSNNFAIIENICNKHHVPFLDYSSSDELCNNYKLYKEPMHLNDKGAKLFSSIVASDIHSVLIQK